MSLRALCSEQKYTGYWPRLALPYGIGGMGFPGVAD
jgi:hypothetical protein